MNNKYIHSFRIGECVFHMIDPSEDDRGYPDGAAGPPLDCNDSHWNEAEINSYPQSPGYYAAALRNYDNLKTMYISLPVEKLYYDGKQFSRKRTPHNSLYRNKNVFVDYWCEIPENGVLPPCYFGY